MRGCEGSKADALRLSAASMILDRGVGKAAQSVALDLNLTKKLDELSDDELIALRDRYAALATGAPKVIERLAEQEQAPELADDGETLCEGILRPPTTNLDAHLRNSVR